MNPWQQSWPTKIDYWQTKKDKGNAAECFSVNSVPGLSKAFIACKHGTSNGIFKFHNCGGQVYEATNKWKSAMQLEGKSLVAEGIKEEGITLILDNTLQAPKEDMLMNAPVYDQYEEEEEEEVSDSILPIENNKVKECILEPVYDPFVEEEVDADIEQEGGEVRVSRGCLGFLSINSFQDCVLYDEKTMNVCHLLLASGRPHQHDWKIIHGRRCSTHIMYNMVQPYNLQPKKRKVNPKPMVKMKGGSVVWDFAV